MQDYIGDTFSEQLIPSQKSLSIHNSRAQFLDTLATLMGCKENLSGGLPDGKRPDVLRCNTVKNILFIGDAKHSESPMCRATQARLLEYLRWLSIHISKPERIGIFALCFGKTSDITKWVETISMLSCELGITFYEKGVERFERGLIVVHFVFKCSTIDFLSKPID